MIERQVQIEKGARLTLVKMAKDVTVAGWDEADVLIRLLEGLEEDLTVDQTETGPAVSAQVPCEVQVPATLPVRVRQALGNLKVKGLKADLNADQVRGNLKLSDVKEAVIAEVYGNVKAERMASLRLVGTIYGNARLKTVKAGDLQNIRGNLRAKAMDHLRASRIGGNLQAKEFGNTLNADKVGGNARLKGIAGAVTLNQVGGNLAVKDLTGGAKLAKVGGNLALNGELGAGCTYHFKVGGNAALRLAEGTGARLTLSAEGKLLSSALADGERTARTLTGTLGNGGAEIVVEAGGNVLLGDGEAALGAELGEEISRQVEESLRAIDLEAIGRQVSEEMERSMSRLRVKLEGMNWERIGHRTQRAVERAMEKMQRDIDRLAGKAARRQERLERMAQRAAQRQAVSVDLAGRGTEEPAEPEPTLDEERLSILRMVEQGQITSQEAAMLLDALG